MTKEQNEFKEQMLKQEAKKSIEWNKKLKQLQQEHNAQLEEFQMQTSRMENEKARIQDQLMGRLKGRSNQAADSELQRKLGEVTQQLQSKHNEVERLNEAHAENLQNQREMIMGMAWDTVEAQREALLRGRRSDP
jgi:hypothetical protein